MSIIAIFTTSLLLLIFVLSVTVIIYWHLATRGTWRKWPAGQSLMALLTIIALGFGWGGVNRLLGDYAWKQSILLVLYGLFAVGIAMIGVTIHEEMAAGKKRQAAKAPEDQTGLITIVVATTNEEKTDGKL